MKHADGEPVVDDLLGGEVAIGTPIGSSSQMCFISLTLRAPAVAASEEIDDRTGILGESCNLHRTVLRKAPLA